MSEIICQKCSSRVSTFGIASGNNIMCKECGAAYALASYVADINDLKVDLEYEFIGFKCLHALSGFNSCQNMCPTSYMYCEEHVSDEWFEKIDGWKLSAETTAKNYADRLEQMKESKKTWLIQKVSGIGEDDSI